VFKYGSCAKTSGNGPVKSLCDKSLKEKELASLGINILVDDKLRNISLSKEKLLDIKFHKYALQSSKS
jgi:hypothetical protein